MSAWQKSGWVGTTVTLVGAALAAGSFTGASTAQGAFGNVASANPRTGVENNVLAAGLTQTSVAWGSLPLTNPDTANGVTYYGYSTANGGPLTQDAHEAYKTEPDKNVYLVLNGHHYLYQGHETGPRGYVTRIDLDQTDPAKRVSLVSDVDATGKKLPTFDGITWDPFSKQLLLTAESKAPTGGVWAVTLDADGNPTTGAAVALTGIGSGGFEGIQNDADGNVWIVEDIGGGTESGRPIRAVQVGGPLGAYFPRALFDTPFDYEAFAARDGLIGHGGIVVFNDTVDMRKQARFALEFCAVESCGKCTPCRVGAVRGVETIDRLSAGRAPDKQMEILRDLCETMKFGSLCALGGFTPYPVMSALTHFPEDFKPAPVRVAAE